MEDVPYVEDRLRQMNDQQYKEVPLIIQSSVLAEAPPPATAHRGLAEVLSEPPTTRMPALKTTAAATRGRKWIGARTQSGMYQRNKDQLNRYVVWRFIKL